METVLILCRFAAWTSLCGQCPYGRLWPLARMGMMRIAAGLLTVALLLAPRFAHADLAAVEALVAKKSAIIEMMHGQARQAPLTAAQDDRYREYFVPRSVDERARLKAQIDRISLQVQ